MHQATGHTLCKWMIGFTLVASPLAVASEGLKASESQPMGRGIPDESAANPGGRALLADLGELSIVRREEAILEALNKGFVPDFLRSMRPVTILEKGHQLTFWVLPDYLALGHNDDYIHIPLTFFSARKIANSWGFVLPTSKMVDAIFQQAECILWPRIYPPDAAMMSVAWLEAHSFLIQSQRFAEGDFTRLVAGHKKDIVLSQRLKNREKKIAIYGWQNIRNGENIQPLSTWHGDRYVDYSHGLRLVGPMALLDGQMMPIKQIMADPILSSLLSREGPLQVDQLMREPRLLPESQEIVAQH